MSFFFLHTFSATFAFKKLDFSKESNYIPPTFQGVFSFAYSIEVWLQNTGVCQGWILAPCLFSGKPRLTMAITAFDLFTLITWNTQTSNYFRRQSSGKNLIKFYYCKWEIYNSCTTHACRAGIIMNWPMLWVEWRTGFRMTILTFSLGIRPSLTSTGPADQSHWQAPDLFVHFSWIWVIFPTDTPICLNVLFTSWIYVWFALILRGLFGAHFKMYIK